MLALLARVARGAVGERLLILGAYRDADAVGTPLLGAIAELRRDCDVEHVAVEGLSVDEVAALLEGAADPHRIHDRTDGNPFFVREVVRHLAERRDGVEDVPESVSDVVLARVGRLSRAGAGALSAASVLGVSFELPVLQALTASVDLLDALDEAAAAGLVDDAGGGNNRFAHALTRDAVYGSTGQAAAATFTIVPRPRSRRCTVSIPARSSPQSRCSSSPAPARSNWPSAPRTGRWSTRATSRR